MALLSEQLLGNRSIDDISEMVKGMVNDYVAGNDLVAGDLVKFKEPRETIATPQGIYTVTGGSIGANTPLYAGQFILEETNEYTKVLMNLGHQAHIVKIYASGITETIASSDLGTTTYRNGILIKLDALRYLYVCYYGTYMNYTVVNLNTEYTTITNAGLTSLLTGQSFSSTNTPLRATLIDTDKVLVSWTNENYYLMRTIVSITGNTATAITSIATNAEATYDMSLTTVATDVVFCSYIITGGYCKYLFYSISGTTVTPSAITQFATDGYINGTSAGMLVNKCNSTDNRYVITYKISSGFKMIVGTIDVETLTFTSIQINSITKQAGSLNMDVARIKDDTFVVNYTGYTALVYINSNSVVTVLHFIANGNSLNAYTAISYRNNTVYNQYIKQLVSLRYSTASTLTYNYEMIMNYYNDKILLINKPMVVKSSIMQPPSNYIDILNNTAMVSTNMITLPLSDNRVITLIPQTTTSTAYSIAQYKNGKWSILGEGTYVASTALTYFSAWNLSNDRILISQGTYFYVISISSTNTITVGTPVSNTSTGYVGVGNSQFAYVQLSDSLFMFKYLNTYAYVFALSITGLVVTMGASIYVNTITPSESFLVKASATTAVVGTRASGSYLYTNVITVSGTTCTSGTSAYPNGTAALTYTDFIAEYVTDNVFIMSQTKPSVYSFYIYRMTVSATVTMGNNLYVDGTASSCQTYGMAYDPVNETIVANVILSAIYTTIFLGFPPTATSAISTIKITGAETMTGYLLKICKNYKRNWAIKGTKLLIPGYPMTSTTLNAMILYDLKNGICERLIADLGDNIMLPSSGYNFYDSVGVLTNGTVFYSHYKYANGTGLRLGCPYFSDVIIGVVTNTVSKGEIAKVKGFGFEYDTYGGM